MSATILAIESSCDDTSAAVIRNGVVLSNIISSQKVHAQYGGVVPELASRQHQLNIIAVVDIALKESRILKSQVDAIAVTRGPGLLGSLIVGVSFAKSLALSLGIPLIDVHHMKAHVMAHFIQKPYPVFPFLCLTVSGGHTQIVLVNDYLDMEVVGSTRDDAAGEAFDKTGKMLGLDYPSGPIIDKLARKGQPRFEFPKSKIPGLDFSFSGLKTAILYFLRDELSKDPEFVQREMANICASVQKSIIDMLMEKIIRASEIYNIREIAIAGGVSANSGLRKRLVEEAEKRHWNRYIPELQYCMDNAGMIGIAAYYKYLVGSFADQTISAQPRMPF